jgi:adenylate cyclase class IV
MTEEKFESEIRILIKDVNPFKKTLTSLNAQIIKSYSFKDHCYKPKGVAWNLEEKIMRIREWKNKSQLLFTKIKVLKFKDISFKQSFFPEGKLILYEGTLQEAQILLKEWNFDLWFIIEKEEGHLYNIKKPFDVTIALEKIKNLGYTAEIEFWGENVDEIYNKFQKSISLLKLNLKTITYKPLPQIYYENSIK